MGATYKFDDLPEMVGKLLIEIKDLRQEVRELKQPSEKEGEYLSLEKAALFLGVTKTALRQNKNVPAIMRFNKLYYIKSELEAFMEAGKVKTKAPKKFVISQ